MKECRIKTRKAGIKEKKKKNKVMRTGLPQKVTMSII